MCVSVTRWYYVKTVKRRIILEQSTREYEVFRHVNGIAIFNAVMSDVVKIWGQSNCRYVIAEFYSSRITLHASHVWHASQKVVYPSMG